MPESRYAEVYGTPSMTAPTTLEPSCAAGAPGAGCRGMGSGKTGIIPGMPDKLPVNCRIADMAIFYLKLHRKIPEKIKSPLISVISKKQKL
ncbi:MAG: hypothetical protein LLF90_06130 [Methanomicrobiaceae archaeon]|nr:hypothetical protein [Methanomicrobiaceae archaeon]